VPVVVVSPAPVLGFRSWRFYVLRRRVHHGRTGEILAVLGLVGLILIAHDWRDRPWDWVIEPGD
jgi:hypothetical protein